MCLFKRNKIKPIELIDKFKDINFNYLIDEYFKFNNIIVNAKFDYINNKICILLDSKYKIPNYKNNKYIYYEYIKTCFNRHYNIDIDIVDVKKYTIFIFF